MAYNAIDNNEIEVGDAIKQSLMQKIKDNFDYLYGIAPTGGGGNGSLQNPSFDVDSDSDGDPDNWTVTNYSAGTHALDATNAAHGAYALKFVHPGGAGNGGGYADSSFMECAEALPFAVHFLHKCSQAGVKVQVVVRYFDETGVDLSADETIYSETSNPTSWEKIITAIATPPATAQYCKIRFIGGATDTDPGSSTNIWFDGVSIGAPGFTASATGFIVASASSHSSYSPTYHLCAEGVVPAGGTLYSSFYLAGGVNNKTIYARVYVNGSAVGTEHSTNSAGVTEKTDASITVERGDLIQIYAKGDDTVDQETNATIYGWVLRSSTGEDKCFAIREIPNF